MDAQHEGAGASGFLKGPCDETGEPLFCLMPFRMMYLGINCITVCCWVKEILGTTAAVAQQEFMDAWRDCALERVRQSIRDRSYRYCNTQICPELNGCRRNMHTAAQLKTAYPLIYEYVVNAKARYEGFPDILNLQFDTACNQFCPSCCRQKLPQLQEADMQRYLLGIKALGPHLKHIFCAGIGDPFVSSSYKKLFADLNEADYPNLTKIVLQTNGMLWNEENWNALSSFARARIISAVISIDGATEKTYMMNRRGGDFRMLCENLRFIKRLRIQGPLQYLEINYVYQANNFEEMPLMVALAKKYCVDKLVFSKIANWGTYTEEQYKAIAVWDAQHPRHRDLQNVLQQPEMQDPIACVIW